MRGTVPDISRLQHRGAARSVPRALFHTRGRFTMIGLLIVRWVLLPVDHAIDEVARRRICNTLQRAADPRGWLSCMIADAVLLA